VNVGEVIAGKRVVVCGGSGGVGKTTTAAAVALGAAAAGARACVVTVDPAKRLADSLGLEELGNEPALVDPALFAAAGVEVVGELWAMMLDPKRTFDDIIERLAPDESTRDQILANRIYQELSNAVAGTQEYTAMAKLQDLVDRHDFDVIVLDTPPSRNALDFLDAPDRLTSFLEGRAIKVFLAPAGITGRILGTGTGLVFSGLKRVTGIDLLQDLSVFFRSLGGLLEGFKARAQATEELLRDPGTTFLLVTSPEREPIDEALYFWRKLKAARMPFGGVIVNRVHRAGAGEADPAEVAGALAADLGEDLAGRVADAYADEHVLAERDRENIARLESRLDADRLLRVPHLDSDVHDIAGLARVNRFLFVSEEERELRLDEAVA
jgi:anion-transporting  ArsA/GET3 family ATPase